ncbi:MAG TPA: hypothetical protein VNO33_13465, partial [Kofleriaceae bacterium]|nr:hypothetical protein [Kofleriaceae bacterium]
MGTRRQRSRAGSFELLAKLTARLASTSRLDHIAGPIVDQIAALGFGMVWVARLDENGRRLLTIKEVIDGTDTTSRAPEVMLDMRRPIGHGFRNRRMVIIQDPDTLYILDEDSEPIPPGVLALNPAPTSSESESATSATTSSPRSRRPGALAEVRVPARSPSCGRLRVRRSAGARPDRTPVASASATVKRSTLASIRTASSRGIAPGPN